MPGNFYGRRRMYPQRRSLGTVVNSIKNDHNAVAATTASTNLVVNIANAIDAPTNAVTNSVKRGCIIKALWLEWWYYGLSAGNTNDIVDAYLMKNPGNNLTNPNPGTVGSSNEKSYVFREWKGLAGNKSLGGTPYNQRGRWFKIPKKFQRFAIDDRLQLVVRSATTGNLCHKSIYKWYT